MDNATVAKTAGPVKCECGSWYADQNGVDCCIGNRHHVERYRHDARNQFSHTFETEISTVCAECGKSITANYVKRDWMLTVKVYPHICPIQGPEDAE